MRPKHIVVLLDSNEDNRAVLKFMIETRGFEALTASSIPEAVLHCRHRNVRLVVAQLADAGHCGNPLVAQVKAINTDTTVLLLSDTVRAGELAYTADAFLGKMQQTPANVFDRVKSLTARKRGPKSVRPVIAQELVG